MKIQSITTGWSVAQDQAHAAIVAAFTPFGSLTQGVDPAQLARDVLAFMGQDLNHSLAGDILRQLWAATTQDVAAVEFDGRAAVKLRTPTSGTVIKVRYEGTRGGQTEAAVSVDFGPDGSESRAAEILTAAELAGVRFVAHDPSGALLERDDVLFALYERAEGLVALREEGMNEELIARAKSVRNKLEALMTE